MAPAVKECVEFPLSLRVLAIAHRVEAIAIRFLLLLGGGHRYSVGGHCYWIPFAIGPCDVALAGGKKTTRNQRLLVERDVHLLH